MNEYLLSVNTFNKPKIISGNKGNYYILLRLLLMKPGTNPLFPLMGCDLKSRLSFATEDDLQDIQIDVQKQISNYAPTLAVENIEMTMNSDKSVTIKISTDVEEYDYSTTDFDLSLDSLQEESR